MQEFHVKRNYVILIAAVLVTAVSLYAMEPFYIPPYYTQSDFLVRTPGSSSDATGAFFNPAVLGIMKGPELQFFWNDLADENLNLKNWTAAFATNGFGFNLQHWDYGYMNRFGEVSRYELYDYQIAFGGGDASHAGGIAYSWSKGTQGPGMERNDVLSFGSLNRPNRYASIGFVGHYALQDRDLRGILDLGIRPLGTNLLTIYGDAAMASNENFEDIKWAAGAAIEPLPGIALMGKFFQGGAYMAGITFSVSGAAASVLPHFDEDGEQTYNTYGVRVGYPKPDLITNRMMKDKFYYNLVFDSKLKYQRYKLFDKGGHTLTELLDALDEVKNDPRVAGIAIKITEDMSGTPEMIWEVREKLLDVKKMGKNIVVFLERGGIGEYYLASAADKLMVDPECSVILIGVNLGRSYYRSMLDKIGIGIDEWRFFKYKSAMEGYSRTNMSEADREQLGLITNRFYEQFREDICESRDISLDDFDYIIDNVGMPVSYTHLRAHET